jgi:hypothetical protein
MEEYLSANPGFAHIKGKAGDGEKDKGGTCSLFDVDLEDIDGMAEKIFDAIQKQKKAAGLPLDTK